MGINSWPFSSKSRSFGGSFGGSFKKLKDDQGAKPCCKSTKPARNKETPDSPPVLKLEPEKRWGAKALMSLFRPPSPSYQTIATTSRPPSPSSSSQPSSSSHPYVSLLDPGTAPSPLDSDTLEFETEDCDDARRYKTLQFDVCRMSTEILEKETELETIKERHRHRLSLQSMSAPRPVSYCPVPDWTKDSEERVSMIDRPRPVSKRDSLTPAAGLGGETQGEAEGEEEEEAKIEEAESNAEASNTPGPTNEPVFSKRRLSWGSLKGKQLFGGNKRNTHPFAPERSDGKVQRTEQIVADQALFSLPQ
ncbi:hypothetical protein K491DRAFT_710613 [Lophiostoma macrostomum CBS 122681]|uniref:Uncharacterized protein n=1 Tax=Lophiostoma macrostomum CBS 122681 TaxID=1314788 RepID=A0A6A6TR28_9PLEO|nr:hypothetical protein K491DRAFT_710613 [Lophiostoma macrostomum CBS 122681]